MNSSVNACLGPLNVIHRDERIVHIVHPLHQAVNAELLPNCTLKKRICEGVIPRGGSRQLGF